MTRKKVGSTVKSLICSCSLLVVALALGPATARANSISDPVVVNQAIACGSSYVCTAINSLTFGFTLNTSPHDVLHFTNMTGTNWTKLTLSETGVAASDITCSSNIFSCSVVANGSNGASIVLTAFGSMIGVPAGQSFELGFGCKGGGCAAWPADLSFTGIADPVPEPGTTALLVTGLGMVAAAFVSRRRAAGLLVNA